MSHWQTGKIDLKCSLNVLKKALINVMPEWEQNLEIDEKGGLKASYHGSSVSQTYQVVVRGSKGQIPSLYSDVGMSKNAEGTWDVGGDYNIGSLKKKITSEVMRMRAIAIAQMRGYDIIRNENNEDETVTDIRVDVENAKELLS